MTKMSKSDAGKLGGYKSSIITAVRHNDRIKNTIKIHLDAKNVNYHLTIFNVKTLFVITHALQFITTKIETLIAG